MLHGEVAPRRFPSVSDTASYLISVPLCKKRSSPHVMPLMTADGEERQVTHTLEDDVVTTSLCLWNDSLV